MVFRNVIIQKCLSSGLKKMEDIKYYKGNPNYAMMPQWISIEPVMLSKEEFEKIFLNNDRFCKSCKKEYDMNCNDWWYNFSYRYNGENHLRLARVTVGRNDNWYQFEKGHETLTEAEIKYPIPVYVRIYLDSYGRVFFC